MYAIVNRAGLTCAVAALAFLLVVPPGSNPAAADASPAESDVAYLVQLGLMRGHLRVGVELYRQGHHAQAVSHMKHPSDELYAGMLPAFAARGVPGFGDALTRLAEDVREDAGSVAVTASYEALLERIAAAEEVVQPVDADTRRQVIAGLLRTAAIEYDEGVVNGSVHEVHEYQDAYGFAQVAAEHAAHADPQAAAAIAALQMLWPVLVPQDETLGNAEDIAVTAGRIDRRQPGHD